MPTKTKQPSKRTLKRAANLLQRTHDWIEVNGFDINSYGVWDKETILARGDSVGPAMCYIGTVRFEAGIEPSPSHGDPADGDGPELEIALAQLDEIARPRIRRIARTLRDADESDWNGNLVDWRGQLLPPDEVDTGRFVEALGFLIAARAEERFPITNRDDWDDRRVIAEKREAYQRDYALKLLRKALTEIYGD